MEPKCAVPDSSNVWSSQGSEEPVGPWKQVTWVMMPGVVTSTVASVMETGHSSPMAFQYSSSWSANAFSAPFHPVRDVGTVCTPVMVLSLSPTLITSSAPFLERSTFAEAPPVAVTCSRWRR